MAGTRTSFSDKIAVLLEGNQMLAKEFERAVEAIVKGKVEPTIIEDIAAYAAYKINLKVRQN